MDRKILSRGKDTELAYPHMHPCDKPVLLVNFDDTVNRPHKPKACKKTNRTFSN
jgi:hypothetical protein